MSLPVALPQRPFNVMHYGYDPEASLDTGCFSAPKMKIYAIGDPHLKKIIFPSEQLIFNKNGEISAQIYSSLDPEELTYFLPSSSLLKDVEELKSTRLLLSKGKRDSGCWPRKVDLIQRETDLAFRIHFALKPYFDAIKRPCLEETVAVRGPSGEEFWYEPLLTNHPR